MNDEFDVFVNRVWVGTVTVVGGSSVARNAARHKFCILPEDTLTVSPRVYDKQEEKEDGQL